MHLQGTIFYNFKKSFDDFDNTNILFHAVELSIEKFKLSKYSDFSFEVCLNFSVFCLILTKNRGVCSRSCGI